MESLFAATLWAPQTIPKITTNINYNSNTIKDSLQEKILHIFSKNTDTIISAIFEM